MAEAIPPISISQALPGVEREVAPTGPLPLSENPFEVILRRAVDALEGVSQTEAAANRLIDLYVAGKAELSDVMIATSKASIAVQLAVTVVTSAVNTFKEITQMQI